MRPDSPLRLEHVHNNDGMVKKNTGGARAGGGVFSLVALGLPRAC